MRPVRGLLGVRAGWALGGLGLIAILLGFAPPQLITMFAIPELRRKILITLAFLAVYRIGYFVPLPMIDHAALGEKITYPCLARKQLPVDPGAS